MRSTSRTDLPSGGRLSRRRFLLGTTAILSAACAPLAAGSAPLELAGIPIVLDDDLREDRIYFVAGWLTPGPEDLAGPGEGSTWHA